MAIRLLSITTDASPNTALGLTSALGHTTVENAGTALEGLEHLRVSKFDAVVAFFPMDDWTPAELLEEVQRVDSTMPVIVVSGDATLSVAVRLTRLGAYHVLDGTTDGEKLGEIVRSAAGWRFERRLALSGVAPSREPWRKLLVGGSKAMENVMQVISLIGARKSTVFLTGETGTGKKVVARAIHMAGPRSHLPLVCVNCSALPENLLEAELFGHVKGAFTGAVNSRVGRFEQAHRSTIFLDEIGDMPLELQAKLLRVLQEREFQRLGSSETIHVDIRVIAATNADLADRMRQGRFREDLYYRLNVVPLALPPLRERLRDIPSLVDHFIEKICLQEDLPLRKVTPETIGRLTQFSWPGNVRQLENAVEMAIALCGDRTVLYPSDFPLPSLAASKPIPVGRTPIIAVPDDGLDFERTVGGIERAILEQAMQKTGGNKKQAAEMLRLKRTTFTAKLKSLSEALNAAEHATAGAYH